MINKVYVIHLGIQKGHRKCNTFREQWMSVEIIYLNLQEYFFLEMYAL
jgi:hypothetical protein